ncbi:MAG: hypothetical protein KCCBMMGE_01849 [Candidatus Methanoperedenaceae archaeon GB37]|nr:MAG: hypothetical protein KCCBMMGE_01849 [Candidatus Methanoperedenaceae archaeon GB37]
MADKARREGILSLEGFIKESHDEFLKYGLRLCVGWCRTSVYQTNIRKRYKKFFRAA